MTAAVPLNNLATPLLAGYQPQPGAYDELLDARGQLRPQYRHLMGELEALGTPQLARRWGQARQSLLDNGVTYNVYGDPRGADRPWTLDPIPLLIEASEFSQLADAVTQRASLMDAVLQDLYGPQRLLRSRRLPPELVYADAAMLRPCHGLPRPGGRMLVHYAVDLARSPDGKWWVIRDRAQAPSGAGYALENRLVLGRALANIYRHTHVHRLAGYFSTVVESLRNLSPRSLDAPRMVLLTPGPHNETYFEHAYLARYLGLTLAEGADLTVRDDTVYLKTLSGLQRVDVVVRRLDDAWADPLELRSDSTLGVAGLVQAARRGRVAISNALGTGLAESGALLAFSGALCEQLLGEPLKLPNVATWWCGQSDERAYVLDHLQDLVIKPTGGGRPGDEPIFGDQLSDAQQHDLRQRITHTPYAFFAQESVTLSTAPVWDLDGARGVGGLSPRHVMLRLFATATADGSYEVMPGGLTRCGTAPESRVTSMQRGGGSKDTWVLAEAAVPQVSLLPPVGRPLELSRGHLDLSSRVADNLYWLGRYAERTDAAVRLVRALAMRMDRDLAGAAADAIPELGAALDAAGFPDILDEPALLAWVLDPQHPTGLHALIHRVRRLAAEARDRVSPDTWRIVSRLESAAASAALDHELPDAIALLDRMITIFAAFAGLNHESMTRTFAWHFLSMGRRTERAGMQIDVLRAALVRPRGNATAVLDALLEAADSTMTYRFRYRDTPRPEAVIDLLLLDETNPRSVAFQLARLQEHLDALPASTPAAPRPEHQRLCMGMLTAVRLADAHQLSTIVEGRITPGRATPSRARRPALARLLNELADHLPALSDALTRRYLTHAQSPRQL